VCDAEHAEQGDKYGLVLSDDGSKMTFYIRFSLAQQLQPLPDDRSGNQPGPPIFDGGSLPDQQLPPLLDGGSFPEQQLPPLLTDGSLQQLPTVCGDTPPVGYYANQQEQLQGTAVDADVMPVCLIKPVAGEAATITEEELQAKVTWGVQAVKATGTSLTGAGVKVSTQQVSCKRWRH
jgi:hypothetical protein